VAPALVVIPAALRTHEALDLALRCLVSVRATAPHVQALVVDDGAPERALARLLEAAAAELGIAHVAREAEGGRAAAVNVGLEVARAYGMDAVLLDPMVELVEPGWLERLRSRTDTAGRPAAVVGGRLVDGQGLLAHAGFGFSLFSRSWYGRYQHGPGELPAALAPAACPVGARLQFIRHECLHVVRGYDEELGDHLADVEYCLRVFAAGLECVYEPGARARWNGPAETGRPDRARVLAEARLRSEHAAVDFSPWVAPIL
jgi:GT2 family glycosyltransferase